MLVTFTEKIAVIDNELRKHRSKWQLKARPDIDYDDVAQIIRFHIYTKWDQWDQTRPLEPWLHTTIINQITNLLRNLYSGFSRPCLKCDANEGGDLCRIYKKQCAACPLFAKWTRGKKQAHDVKIPLPIENHTLEVESLQSDFIDYESAARIIHIRMKPKLTNVQYKVYDMLYVQNLGEDEIAMKMGYKKNEDIKRKGIRYKQLENYKKKFVEIARKIVQEDDLA